MTNSRASRLCDLLQIDLPIVQAPMAGVSSPAMAAAVANAGGLGSIGVGATDAAGASAMIAAEGSANARTGRSTSTSSAIARPWPTRRARRLDPASGPRSPGWALRRRRRLTEIYRSFLVDDASRRCSSRRGPGSSASISACRRRTASAALKDAGIVLFASATSPAEAPAWPRPRGWTRSLPKAGRPAAIAASSTLKPRTTGWGRSR